MNNALEDKKPKKRGRPKKSDQEKQSFEDPKIDHTLQYQKMMGSFFDLTGNYLASATGYEGFKLRPDEKQVLSEQAAEVMIEFAPLLNSKYAKLGIFTTTLVSIYGIKFYGFQNTMIEEINKKALESNE